MYFAILEQKNFFAPKGVGHSSASFRPDFASGVAFAAEI